MDNGIALGAASFLRLAGGARIVRSLGAIALAIASGASVGATCTWTGSADSSWANVFNWTCPLPIGPQAGDDLVFPDNPFTTTMVDDIASLSINSMSFSGTAGGYALTGTGQLTITGATAIVNRATGNGQNTLGLANPIKLGAPSATIDNTTNNKGWLFLNGPLDLNGSVLHVTWDSSTPHAYFNGVISGNGGIVLTGSGGDVGVVLGGNNTFTGPVTVEGGYLQVTHANALGAGGSAQNGTSIMAAATFIIDADIGNEWLSLEAGSGSNGNSNMQANGTRTWGGPVAMSATQSAQTVSFNLLGSQITFAGAVTGDAGILCCNGNGKVVLANTGNTYSGPSSLTQTIGWLVAGANGTLSPASAIELGGQAGGKLELGAFVVSSAGLSGSPGSVFKVTTGGKLGTSGPVSLANTTLDLTVAGNPANGATFTIIDNTSSNPVIGTFNGIAEGGSIVAGGYQFNVSYVGGTGNDVVLTVAGQAGPPTLTVTKAGTGTGTVSGNANAINCGATCSAQFAPGTQVNLTATPDAGTTFAGWSGACTGTGACTFTINANASVTAHFTTLTLGKIADIDGNGNYDALTDGLLAMRYMFGLVGTALTGNAVANGATRATPQAIIAYLDDINALLDIDGSGRTDALTDGLMLMRYLFGLRGSALIANAVATGATRTTSVAIESYIGTLTP